MVSEQPKLLKNLGVTRSERYLNHLCSQTFLSLWSHASVYRDQYAQANGTGKELCDMLVVCDDDIIIFSDKLCSFPRTGNLGLDWNRWLKRAVLESARQAWGAERWLRNYPDRIFLDPKCQVRFPFSIPPPDRANYHIVVVAHGYSQGAAEYGRAGDSIPIDSWVLGKTHFVPANHPPRCVIGDVDPEKTFVHVLTEGSLEIVLSTLDTISDFTFYLKKKEALLRSAHRVIASGEEDLLGLYLKEINTEGEHDFVFERHGAGVILENGHWEEYQSSPQRLRQRDADRISYLWDNLIEQFAHHSMHGTEYFVSEPGIAGTERLLRTMAKERRFHRRMLAKAFLEIVAKGANSDRATRYFFDKKLMSKCYVFMTLKQPAFASEDEYRIVRRNLLEACCLVLKRNHPEVLDIVGIATEPISEEVGRSEDAIYIDARIWNADNDAEALELAGRLDIMQNLTQFQSHEDEYPDESSSA